MGHASDHRSAGDHAVVLGASLAGLMSAAGLAERFDRVTIVDRDTLPSTGKPRKGMPRDRHAHILLPSGLRTMGALLPGILEGLKRHGAHEIAAPEFRFYVAGGRLTFGDPTLSILGATRPLIEGVVRDRVRALGVDFLERRLVSGLLADGDGGTVTGVRLGLLDDSTAEDLIEADLVLDATGNNSHSSRWLEELGYTAPDEEQMHVGVYYSTRLFRRDPTDIDGCRHVVVGIPPGGRYGGLALAVEDDRWLVTLVGFLGERPPTELDDFVEHTRTLWRNDLYELVADAEPVSEPAIGAFPAHRRRRYERLRRFPDRYVVLGDALCATNPVYAMGMSVAMHEAQVLSQVIRRHGLDRVGRRFFRRSRPFVDSAWALATGADLAHPAVDGPRPLSWRLVNRYVTRLFPVAHRDPRVADAFLRVNGLLAPPPHLMRPGIAARVLRGGRGNPTADTAPLAGVRS